MNIPKYLSNITVFSKLLTLALLVLLPFIGFYLGIMYERSIKVTTNQKIIYMQAGPECKNQCEHINIGFNETPGEKCCKGLLAIIETRSKVLCEVQTSENLNKIRDISLEQIDFNALIYGIIYL